MADSIRTAHFPHRRREIANRRIRTDQTPIARSVSEIVAAGIIPVAMEMMDRAIIQAIEDSNIRAGYPRDAGAVLLIELDGLESLQPEAMDVFSLKKISKGT